MAPPRYRARTLDTPTNEQLAQKLHHLTQTMQMLSNALLHNNNPPPPPDGNLVGCHEDRRVELATFYFSHEADLWWVHEGDLWWVHEGPACLEEPGFDWSVLKGKLRERFYPSHVRAAMYEEFLHLKQGTMSVVEYHKYFLELARFARVFIPTEAAKVEKFVVGLNCEAEKALTVSKPRLLSEAYDQAAYLSTVQQDQQLRVRQNKKRSEDSASAVLKKPRVTDVPSTTSVVERWVRGGVSTRVSPSKVAAPPPQIRRLVGSMVGRGSKEEPSQGKMLAMSEARVGDNDVMTGTFLVQSIPALVLFDSGASNSFVSSELTGTFLVQSIPALVLFDSGASNSFVSSELVKKLGLTDCVEELYLDYAGLLHDVPSDYIATLESEALQIHLLSHVREA
ncbi:PREDICTED: uncharacterized protein LOC109163775 [Ipomoea nil]|uniref:uncharacterized protein LOC109163775 n=1 Tax=Ipomoea nil TaxID=35883 RepID=UPI0009013FA6|nr:PREDICTED: uncharacterized protein LOC109163775 [Ipomoea nil]